MSSLYGLEVLFSSAARRGKHFEKFLLNGVDLLGTPSKYKPHLYKIEYELQRELKTHFKDMTLRSQEQIELYENPPSGFDKPKKIIDKVFKVKERQEQFSEPLTIFGVLSRKTFAELTERGAPFKDPTINLEHGEHSHRIQLQLLLQMREELGIPIDIPIVQHYKPLASVVLNGHPNDRWNDVITSWDFLFDRNQFGKDDVNSPFNTTSQMDLTSPENLHFSITKLYKNDLPVLSFLIESREQKRIQEGFTNPYHKYQNVARHVALKWYGMPLESLPQKVRTEIYEMISKGVILRSGDMFNINS